jgi:hypothetical protein
MARAVRWLIGHRPILWLISLVWFIMMLPFVATRWNAIATLWGVLGVGLLVSLILEEQGEDIQRRVWLRKNAVHVRSFLEQVLNSAGLVATFAVGLPNDISTPLRFADKIAKRREVAKQARALAKAYGEGKAPVHALTLPNYDNWSVTVADSRKWIGAYVSSNLPLLSRMTEVLGLINRFDLVTAFVSTTFATGTPPEEIESFQRSTRLMVTNAAIDLCEQCSELLFEAGVIK